MQPSAKTQPFNPNEETTLWLRVGMTIQMTKAEALEILKGNTEVFCALIANQDTWEVNGETYVPADTADLNDAGIPIRDEDRSDGFTVQ